MSTSDEEPPNVEDEGWEDEDGSWWDVLAASPFGDVAIYATICAVGAALIIAWRSIPILVLIACIGVVLLSVFVISRFVIRSGGSHAYVLAAAIAIGGLMVAAAIAYFVWAISCDC